MPAPVSSSVLPSFPRRDDTRSERPRNSARAAIAPEAVPALAGIIVGAGSGEV